MPEKTKLENFLLGLTPSETGELAREALDMMEKEKAVEVCAQWAVDNKMIEEMIGALEDAEQEGPEEDDPDAEGDEEGEEELA